MCVCVCVWCWGYMSQEAVWDPQWVFPTGLQFSQEELAVEVQKLLQVPENNGAFPPQVLRKVGSVHLREVMMDDVRQRANVLLLRGHHLVHDVTQLTAHTDTQSHTHTHSYSDSVSQSTHAYIQLCSLSKSTSETKVIPH